jgi:DNA-binding HxlR family transcriptional regulator
VEFTLAVVGGKWRTVILAWLKEAPHRYGELRKRMPGLADKVLTQQIKELEALGLISKKAVVGPRSKLTHTYELTARGETLRPVLDAMYDWGAAMAPELKVRVGPAPTRSAMKN